MDEMITRSATFEDFYCQVYCQKRPLMTGKKKATVSDLPVALYPKSILHDILSFKLLVEK